MSEHKKDRTLAKPSGKRFKSVDELMAGLDMPAEVVQEAKKNADARQLTLKLSLMRLKAGVTQAEMAKRLDITQGAVSKLENGFDDDVTVKHLRAYAEATKMNVGFAVGRPPNHVEAIKLHAMGIRNHMKELAKLAHNDARNPGVLWRGVFQYLEFPLRVPAGHAQRQRNPDAY